MSKLIETQRYLGDMEDDQTFNFWFSSCDKDGASIAITDIGTIKVAYLSTIYTAPEGITITQDADGLTGLHRVEVDLSISWRYSPGRDYVLFLFDTVVDSETSTVILCHFSIKKRLK